ncbi:MAG: CYTH domain-containing protein [Streptosporangiaceae bacterium]|jgi:inorganic triphosphatase YgiF
MDTEPTSYLETEQKYDADPGFAMPDFGALPGCSVAGPEHYELSATYFDTGDLRLAANRVTLRRRTGGTDEAWHLKLPVRPGTRRELHLPLSEGTETVPRQMQAMVADITGGAALHPIAQLDTSRTVRRLTSSEGQVLAEVADDEVTARRLGPEARLGPEGSPMRWHEIEVELVSGPPTVLESAGKLLREAGARPSASASKLGRLLAAD